MASTYTAYNFQLVNKRTGRPIDDDSGQFIIYTVNTPVKATVYSDAAGTSLTQPGTLSNGYGKFWTTADVTSVDMTVLTSTGRSYFLEGLTPSQHRIDVDTEQLEYVLTLGWAIKSAHADAVVSALGFQLQNGMRIKDVFVQKQSAGVGVGAGLLLDFGVSGDPDGFVDGITCTATGYDTIERVKLAVATDCVGFTNVLATAQVRGVLLMDYRAGMDTATVAGQGGYFVKKSYVASLVTTTNNLVFAITATSSLTTVAGSQGYVFYTYDLIPTAGN